MTPVATLREAAPPLQRGNPRNPLAPQCPMPNAQLQLTI